MLPNGAALPIPGQSAHLAVTTQKTSNPVYATDRSDKKLTSKIPDVATNVPYDMSGLICSFIMARFAITEPVLTPFPMFEPATGRHVLLSNDSQDLIDSLSSGSISTRVNQSDNVEPSLLLTIHRQLALSTYSRCVTEIFPLDLPLPAPGEEQPLDSEQLQFPKTCTVAAEDVPYLPSAHCLHHPP